MEIAPDLVVIPKRGYDVKASVSANAPTSDDIFTGMHTHDDAFLIVGDALSSDRLSEVTISDVAGLILDALGGSGCSTLS
jgi:predicted AlkP superfamily phosphohydrolase/phosphomutase